MLIIPLEKDNISINHLVKLVIVQKVVAKNIQFMRH